MLTYAQVGKVLTVYIPLLENTMMTSKRSAPRKGRSQQVTIKTFANAVRDAVGAYRALCELTGRRGGYALRGQLEALRRYAYGVIDAVREGSKVDRKVRTTYHFAVRIAEDLEKQFDSAVEAGANEVIEILDAVRKAAPSLIVENEPEIIRLQETFRASMSAEQVYHADIIAAYKAMRQHAIGLLRAVDAAKAAEREHLRREKEIALADELEAELATIDF